MQDLIYASIISVLFIIIFVIAEIWHKFGAKTEITRKFVHFSGAFITIFLPFIFSSHWVVLALALSFGLIMAISKKFHLLQSIHNIERKSDGSIYHPIAIYACFLYASILNQPLFYVISILILAISDALAALTGKTYGKNSFLVEVETKKTMEGSIVFFLSTFLIAHLILLLNTQTGRVESVLIALLIAIIITIFEGVSLKGADNLFIPLATMFILSKNINPSVNNLIFQILALSGFLIGYLLIMRPYKRIGFSGIILLGLINYIIFFFLGNICAFIIFSGSLICQKTNLILGYDCDCADKYRVRPIFYIMSIPLICAFLSTILGNIVLYPFFASLISQGIIIKTRIFDDNLNKGLFWTSIIALITLGVSYVYIR